MIKYQYTIRTNYVKEYFSGTLKGWRIEAVIWHINKTEAQKWIIEHRAIDKEWRIRSYSHEVIEPIEI